MHGEYLPAASLVPHSTYVHELRHELPPAVFAQAVSRLVLVPAYLAAITISTIAIAAGWLPWFVVPLFSLVIGVSFAALTFIGHEAIHGGIVHSRTARQVVGWIGFLPFTVSPRLWAAWRDRIHHANANLPHDPDVYPTLAEYRGNRLIRFLVDSFSLGGRRVRGLLSLLLGFTVQSAHQLVSARRYGFLKRREHTVGDLLRQRWPERYQSMPLRKALGELYRTARVYKDGNTLVDPTTGCEYPTLMPQRA
jgi:hypothetical protein